MKRHRRYRYHSARVRRIRRALLALSALCLLIALGLTIRYRAHSAQTRSNFEALKLAYDTPAQGPQAEGPTVGASDTPEMNGLPLKRLEAAEQHQTSDVQAPSALRETPPSNTAMHPEFVSLFRKNSDLIGWLSADALEAIDFPVVKRDNDYYMSHDFYGRENPAGTVFLDEDGSIRPRSDNLVLHGHNMKNGSMFGKLSRYLDEAFLLADPMFTFSTLYERAAYIPYAVVIASTDPDSPLYADFAQHDFAGAQDRLAYAARLGELSKFSIPVDVRADDRLLTLVTCHGPGDAERLILALRELRPEEEKQALALAFR